MYVFIIMTYAAKTDSHRPVPIIAVSYSSAMALIDNGIGYFRS